MTNAHPAQYIIGRVEAPFRNVDRNGYWLGSRARRAAKMVATVRKARSKSAFDPTKNALCGSGAGKVRRVILKRGGQ